MSTDNTRSALSTKLQEPAGDGETLLEALVVLENASREPIDRSMLDLARKQARCAIANLIAERDAAVARADYALKLEEDANNKRIDAEKERDLVRLQNAPTLAHQPVTAGLEKAIEDVHRCPICAATFCPNDICATDITEGVCHYACLEGSPTVDLTTGEPKEGPIATYRYDSLDEPVSLRLERRK